MPRQPVKEAGILLKQLSGVLYGLVEAGRNGDQLKSQLYSEQMIQILDACGYSDVARKLQLALG